MRRISYFALNLIALAAFADPATAAELAKVRAAAHDDYTRIVFDWGANPGYAAQQSGNVLTLTFNQDANFTITGKDPGSLPRISSFSTSAKAATITVDAGQSVRHFVIGSRIIVDVKGKAAAKTVKAETVAPKDPPQEQPKEQPKEKAVVESKQQDIKPEPETKKADTDAVKVVETPAEIKSEIKSEAKPEAKPEVVADVKPVEVVRPAIPAEKVEKTFDAHMVNITATQAVGLAAYVRGNSLWVIVDQPDYPIVPQIAGPQKDKFPQFKQVPLKDATAFKLALPKGMKVYGEGGGLVWKLVVTPTERKTKAIELDREFTKEKATDGKLVWKTDETRRVIDVVDPDYGDDLKVVTVNSSKSFAGAPQNYVELATLESPAGLVFRSKVDDLTVARTNEAVTISRAQGLALSPEADIASLKLQLQETMEPPKTEDADEADSATGEKPDAEKSANKSTETKKPFTKIFSFESWQMGGREALADNQRIIMSALAGKTEQGRAADLITLAKMQLANGRGPEALGYLDFAQQMVKELADTPEFIALLGAAQALTGQYDRAFANLNNKLLSDNTEIQYWRAFALAELEDWKQADQVLPRDVSLLGHYPDPVRVPLSLTLTEAALRAGDTDTADKILDPLMARSETMPLPYRAAIEYLRGESLRQQNDLEGMKELWEPLAKGKDDLYRAKAGLALTSQQLDKKEIALDKAIDNLEGLRYAWRGDELETAINFKLGKIYMENNQPIKGLTLLRQAASLSPSSDFGKSITNYMTSEFKNLFLTDKISALNPIDAVTIYDEFSELAPVGEEADKISRQLAERLVEADLLPRAENLLQTQIDTRLTGLDGANVALRLASIQLLDGKPDKAIASLNKAGEFLLNVPLDEGTAKRREVALLRARALADQNKPEEAFAALALLQQDPDVLRLRADIAWRAKRWQDAADSLEELIMKLDISLTRPLEPEQADLILNWAVALQLADNRYVLANVREKYSDAMAQTNLSKKFDVVTRPRQSALLADRATINSIIAETEIFKGFLDSFNQEIPKPAAASATSAAPTTAPGE